MRMRDLAYGAAMMLLACVALPSALHAQSRDIIASARVPFAFRLGNRTMPEGVYQFRMSAEYVLQMIGPGAQAFVMVRREDDASPRGTDKGALIFRHSEGYDL